MSDGYCSATLPYIVVIGKMARDMVASCRTCPLAPCGDKRVSWRCMEKIEDHYGVPGRLPRGPKPHTPAHSVNC